MKLDVIFEEYILECSSNCKKSTIDRYLYVYKNYIYPFFKSFEIENILVKDINSWKIKLNNTKLSFQSKKKIYFNFSSILNYAFRVYDIDNVIHKCRGFKKEYINQERTIYTINDFKKYDSQIINIEHKAFFNILFYLGLRRGEALALTWADIKDNEIIINKSKRKGFVSTPKTIYSYRSVKAPTLIFKLLNDLCISKKTIPKQMDFIFNLSETNIARYNKIYAKKANLHCIRIHDFRHSNITFLCSLGVSYSAIAKRVGHKNIKEIIEVYLHSYQNEQNEILTLLEKQIKLNC